MVSIKELLSHPWSANKEKLFGESKLVAVEGNANFNIFEQNAGEDESSIFTNEIEFQNQ